MDTISSFSDLQHPHYIYALVDPRDKSVFYVGKGTKTTRGRTERYLYHAHRARLGDELWNPRKFRKINQIHAAGLEVEYLFLYESADLSEMDAREIEFIAAYRGINSGLTNLTNGGTGGITWQGDHPRKGAVASEETRLKQAAAKRGKPGNRLGYKLTPEQRERAIACLPPVKTGDDNPRAKKFSPETRSLVMSWRLSGVPRTTVAKRLSVDPDVIKRIEREMSAV